LHYFYVFLRFYRHPFDYRQRVPLH
jgi:hypothetical protein